MTLFDIGDLPAVPCAYPMLAGTTGYRYGCRCERCRHARFLQDQPIPTECAAPECNEPRLKHRRWCATHLPAPKPSKIRSEGVCKICGESFWWYESVIIRNSAEIRDIYRAICGNCRNGWMTRIRDHHLDLDWAIRLITTTECDLCHERFTHDKGGRHQSVIDHDHGHCCGKNSCGQCIRGIICQTCNMALGVIEALERRVGRERITAYLHKSW